jgi:hypothetical protein
VVFNMQDAWRDLATSLEKLSFWMNSIHAHSSDPSNYHILIVGTHLDMVHDPADHQILSQKIESVFQECGFWCRVTQPDELNSHLCFFPIDNTDALPNREKSQLHTAINELGQEFVESKNHEYPLRWLQVLDELNRKAADDGTDFMFIDHPATQNDKGAFAPLDPSADKSLYSIAKQSATGKTPAVFSTLCSFLQETGSFLLFRNILIIRPQWIADILFAVVTRPQFQALAVSRFDAHADWEQFEASAIVSERLLAALWWQFKDTPELLIDVMLHHDQMFEIYSNPTAGRQFLVPAMFPMSPMFPGTQDLEDNSPTKSVSDWQVPDRKPACYLVFGQGRAGEIFGATNAPTTQGFMSPRMKLCHIWQICHPTSPLLTSKRALCYLLRPS